MSSKNILLQTTINNVTFIKNEIMRYKDILLSLEKLVNDLSRLSGANEIEISRVKKLIRECMEEDLSELKNSMIKCLPKQSDVDENIGHMHTKINAHGEKIHDIKTYFESTITELFNQIQHVK
jgi:uncharacterized coiled-coil DUF342 family protein